MPLLFPCRSTYYQVLPMCLPEAGATIDIGLTAATEYAYIFTTPYGKSYTGTITTDAEGKAEFAFTDVSRDMLNPWIKLFQLTFYPVSDATPFCNPAPFTICGVQYDNIGIRFIEAEGMSAVIGCQCEEI